MVKPPGAADCQRHEGMRTLGGGTGSGAGMGAAHRELFCRKMSKSLVRRGNKAKGKSVS
jgi:hypothetical protein